MSGGLGIEQERGQPLHKRIRELIRRQTAAGELIDADGRLKTEAELVEYFGVSRVTIRNALSPLVAEGMFERTPGRGTFLRSNHSEQWSGRLLGFQEIIAEAGFTPGARVLLQGMVRSAEADLSDVFEDRVVWQLRRLRTADGEPIAIEHAYYPPDIGLDLQMRDLTSIAMYRVFEDDLGLVIRDATQSIGARLPSDAERRALDVHGPAALVEMERRTVASDGRTIELLRSVYRPDFYKFTINLRRHDR